MDILDILREEMKKNGVAKLKSLRVRVGEMTAVEPGALEFCFETCITDTPLAGAILDIETVPLAGKCSGCGETFRLEHYFTTPCPSCGGKASEVVSGRELEIVSMEVE